MDRNDSPLPYMQQLELFREFTESELEILSTVFRVRRLPAGQLLYREGEATTAFAIVVAGLIESSKEFLPAQAAMLGRAGSGQIVGQKALIDGKRQTATMKAVAPTILLECDRDSFLRLFKANSVFAYKILDLIVTDLSLRLRQIDVELDRMLSDPARTDEQIMNTLSLVGELLGDGNRPQQVTL
jgi:CRP/FNR family cyclic AMP-dependent transcriptional regulator